jgi:hypothetical protein
MESNELVACGTAQVLAGIVAALVVIILDR